jgi:hypothetical protein
VTNPLGALQHLCLKPTRLFAVYRRILQI